MKLPKRVLNLHKKCSNLINKTLKSVLDLSGYFPTLLVFQVIAGDGGGGRGRREGKKKKKKKRNSICDCWRVRQCSPSLPRHTFPCRGRGVTLVNVFVEAARPRVPARAAHRCLLAPPRLFFKKLWLLLECSLCPCPVP